MEPRIHDGDYCVFRAKPEGTRQGKIVLAQYRGPADPETGVCGAAVASRYPAVGKAVAYARAGVGAFCTQHWLNRKWGEKALDLLQAGKLPEEVLGELLRDDKQLGKRQLAIIDRQGRAAVRNPHEKRASSILRPSCHSSTTAVYRNGLSGSHQLGSGITTRPISFCGLFSLTCALRIGYATSTVVL